MSSRYRGCWRVPIDGGPRLGRARAGGQTHYGRRRSHASYTYNLRYACAQILPRFAVRSHSSILLGLLCGGVLPHPWANRNINPAGAHDIRVNNT